VGAGSGVAFGFGVGVHRADPGSLPAGSHAGPPVPRTRPHVPVAQVVELLGYAERAASAQVDLLAAGAGDRRAGADVHRAEQVLLLCRLAADTGARRGELAALQLGDLDGLVLTIERAASEEVIGPTKTRAVRRLTLGPTSTALWQASVQAWKTRSGSDRFGPWLFSADPSHASRLTTGGLGHWFAQLCEAAGMPEVTLHRAEAYGCHRPGRPRTDPSGPVPARARGRLHHAADLLPRPTPA
jgi:integrase